MERWKLPGGWEWATVEEVGETRLGRQRSPKDHHGPNMRPYLRVANVLENRIDIYDVKEMNFTDEEYEIYKLREGDILLNEGQSREFVGRPAIYRGEVPGCCFQNTLIRYRPYGGIPPEYALDLFRHYMHAGFFVEQAQITTNLAHLGVDRLRRLEVPVPPLAEQHRIVTKLNALQSHTHRARETLATLPTLIDHLRQSVLAAAFRGDLTADWRAQHPDAEPATALLQRVHDARRARWEDDEREKMKSRGKLPLDGRWKDRYEEPALVDPTGLPELPKGWLWTTVADVVECLDARRQPITKKDRLPGDVPYYGANGLVDHVQAHLFDEDLVLVTEDETFYGRTKPIAYRISGRSWVNNHAHVLRSIPPIPPDLLCYQLMHYKVEPWLSGTTGRAKLTQGALLSLPIALPGYDELIEIGRRVGSQLKHGEQLLAQAGDLSEAVQEMDRGVLARAFRGDLVPQDPADEPASVLLARLRAQRQALTGDASAGRGRTPRRGRRAAPIAPGPNASASPTGEDAVEIATNDPEPSEPQNMPDPEPAAPAPPPSWILDQVEVWNFRSITHLDLHLDPRLNLFLGDNAHGKTTVLDAISCCLVHILKRLPNVEGFNLRESDIRRTADATTPGFVVRAQLKGGAEWDDECARDKASSTLAELKAMVPQRRGRRELYASLDAVTEQIQRGVEAVVLPVLVYYGVDRAIAELSTKAVATPTDSRALRFQALAGALDAGTRAQGFFDWFYRMQFEEFTAQSERGDLTWRHPELDAVRTAIVAAIPGAKALRVVGRPPQLVVDWTGPAERVETLPFSQMSGGYRTMLAMVGDIARRMVQANPHLGTKSEAIILIDEVDLHLHPKWQLSVVPSLLDAFPNAQFILTTHSEQVISTVRPESVFILTRDADGLQVERPSSTYGATADRLLEDLMVVPRRPPEVQEVLDAYWRLIEEDQGDTEAALTLRARLESWFHQQDSEMVRADMEIRRRRVLGARGRRT